MLAEKKKIYEHTHTKVHIQKQHTQIPSGKNILGGVDIRNVDFL